jgi:hypothetical protein
MHIPEIAHMRDTVLGVGRVTLGVVSLPYQKPKDSGNLVYRDRLLSLRMAYKDLYRGGG